MISPDKLKNADSVRRIWTPLKGRAIISQAEAEVFANALSGAPDLVYILDTKVPADGISLRARQVRLLEALPRFDGELQVLGRPNIPQVLEGYSAPPFLTSGILFERWSILEGPSKWRSHSVDLEVPLDCIKGIIDPPNN